MTAGICCAPPICIQSADFSSRRTTATLALNPPTRPSLFLFSSMSWNSLWRVRGNGFSSTSNLTDKRYGGRSLRIDAARKNVTSRKIQQSKGRMTDKPQKLGMVGIPLESNQLIQGNNLTGDSVLNEDQAIGQVITAQANFMRVIVERCGKSNSVRSVGDDARALAEQDERAGPRKMESGADSEFSRDSGANLHTGVLDSTLLKPPPERLELLCVVRSLLKKIKRRVLVGDRVLVSSIDWTERRGMIEEILDRTSEIVDPPLANVNNLLLVFSIDQPQIDEKVLSRFLVEAESTDIDFTLIINKVDLVEPEVVEAWHAKLADWGYRPVLCSADQNMGLSDVTNHVKNKVTVILGPSGVGKSSLINALRDQNVLSLWHDSDEIRQAAANVDVDKTEIPDYQFYDAAEDFEDLRVGEVSVISGRGRHTTRHVRLLRIPGGVGLLADTPGFSQPSLAKVTSSTLAQLFPEVRNRLANSELGGCGFPNCMHLEEPNCAVADNWERYSHYIDLLDEVRTREKVQKKILGTKRESDMRVKKMGAEGVRKAEPRLALNRHRRESRKQANQSIEEIYREEEELQADIKEDIEKEGRAV